MRRLTCAWIAAALALAPLCARGADLVVWWPEGYYAEEDAAVRETIAAFEQDSGKEVGLVFYSDEELLDRIAAGLEGGQLPDFVFGFWRPNYIQNWVLEDQLVDLTDAIGHFSDLFDPIQLDRAVLLNTKTGQKALYGLPIGQISNYVHVWKGLLEGRVSPSRISPRSGAVLVVLVRRGPACGTQGIGPRQHLGHRPAHVRKG
jgi:ABC-type glycerol-3-phosphate transport system substrate-binding protein